MTAAVKICGLKEPEHVAAAIEAGAALTGFVFFPPSPRSIDIEQARALTAAVPEGVRKVALTVDADDDLLSAIASGAGVDMLQFHGQESPARVADARVRYQLPIIKALPVAEAADVAAAKAYEFCADMILFDAKPPKDATRPGGNAETFDWDLLADLELGLPWMLAGGLTVDNVTDAVRRTHAEMVDVSSGVEDAPGQKSSAKIRAFIEAVKAA